MPSIHRDSLAVTYCVLPLCLSFLEMPVWRLKVEKLSPNCLWQLCSRVWWGFGISPGRADNTPQLLQLLSVVVSKGGAFLRGLAGTVSLGVGWVCWKKRGLGSAWPFSPCPLPSVFDDIIAHKVSCHTPRV